jgi:hypothetical protein
LGLGPVREGDLPGAAVEALHPGDARVQLEGALHGLEDGGLGRLGLGEPKTASTAAFTAATLA